jgi:hypothetical protein
MPSVTARREPHRLQFDAGHPGATFNPGLALHADRLQRLGIGRTAQEKVAAEPDPTASAGNVIYYLKLPQKRWMRLQASSRSEFLVA